MNIQTELRTIPLDLLVNNTGQVEGVRANPRLIKDEDYKRLKKSLRESDLTDIIPLKVLPWMIYSGASKEENRVLFREWIETSKLYPPICLEGGGLITSKI